MSRISSKRRWLIGAGIIFISAIVAICVIRFDSPDRSPHPSRLARLFGSLRESSRSQLPTPASDLAPATAAQSTEVQAPARDSQRRTDASLPQQATNAHVSATSATGEPDALGSSESSANNNGQSADHVVVKRPVANVEELCGEWSATDGTEITFTPDGRFSLNFELFGGETHAEGTYRFENGQVTASAQRVWIYEKDRWVVDDSELTDSETAPVFLTPEGGLIIDDGDGAFTKSPLESTKSPHDNG
jgi:hypothetical protein